MKVAVISKLIKSPYNEILQAIDIRFCKALERADFKPTLLSYSSRVDLESFDGIVISGGNDLSYLVNTELNILRDEFEKAVLREALRLHLPVLGICKGAQGLARYLGASLARVPNISKIHKILWRDNREFSINSYHNFAIYSSKKDAFQAEVLAVSLENWPQNFDHMRDVDFCVTEQKFIEAFISREKKLVGAMWHFEREESLSAASKEIFRLFKEMF